MKLIIGLGNPGKKYINNRHNVGHLFVDFIAPLLHCSIVKKEKLFITMKQSNNETIILAKPTTFMNNSGAAALKLLFVYKIKIENLIVVHDDLDIPLGKFHIQFGVGPQLHNGLESIEQNLKTKDFWRIRIGVDNRLPDKKIPGETYTLQNFLPDEKKLLETEIFPKIFSQLKLNFKML
jgi:PTH1 family peptidyl-tRNA hydrolase